MVVEIDPNTKEKTSREIDHRFVHTLAVNRISANPNEVQIPAQFKCITTACMCWVSSKVLLAGESAVDREGYCFQFQPDPNHIDFHGSIK